VFFEIFLIFFNFCRERAVTVPKFAEGKSMFVFGEFIQ
jgi:hypothetical protein